MVFASLPAVAGVGKQNLEHGAFREADGEQGLLVFQKSSRLESTYAIPPRLSYLFVLGHASSSIYEWCASSFFAFCWVLSRPASIVKWSLSWSLSLHELPLMGQKPMIEASTNDRLARNHSHTGFGTSLCLTSSGIINHKMSWSNSQRRRIVSERVVFWYLPGHQMQTYDIICNKIHFLSNSAGLYRKELLLSVNIVGSCVDI